MPEEKKQSAEAADNQDRIVADPSEAGPSARDKAGDVSPEPASDSAVPQSKLNLILDSVNAFLKSLDEGKEPEPASDPAVPQSKLKQLLTSVNAFLKSLDKEEESEPPIPPEKPLKETVRELMDRCRDREKRHEMLKEFGEWSWTMILRGTMLLLLLAVTIWSTIWALNYSDTHRIKFFPPEEVMEYLSAEHENLENAASQLMPLVGKDDDIPPDRFDAKFIETVKPLRIFGDEYGIYFMTCKDWYNGEHGIFIVKDAEHMPPDLNWGLIEGRIYTYAIYD